MSLCICQVIYVAVRVLRACFEYVYTHTTGLRTTYTLNGTNKRLLDPLVGANGCNALQVYTPCITKHVQYTTTHPHHTTIHERDPRTLNNHYQ